MEVTLDPDATVPLVRPFIARERPLAPVTSDHSHGTDNGVRAYAITGGRSHASGHLEFETMLRATGTGSDAVHTLKFERAEIVRRCEAGALSVAELSAALRIPIGVVRVVAADLLGEGLLEAFQASEHVADDVLLITRLIAGVRAL